MISERDDSRSPDLDQDLNPHRGEEQVRAREHAAEVLASRGVLLFGNESIVEARGGDTMTNASDSAEPDNPAFVLPERRARESASNYTRRIQLAAVDLTRLER